MNMQLPTEDFTTHVMGYKYSPASEIYFLNYAEEDDLAVICNNISHCFTKDIDKVVALNAIRKVSYEEINQMKSDLFLTDDNCEALRCFFPKMTQENIREITNNLVIFEVARKLKVNLIPKTIEIQSRSASSSEFNLLL